MVDAKIVKGGQPSIIIEIAWLHFIGLKKIAKD
jgi:hypothetical protein